MGKPQTKRAKTAEYAQPQPRWIKLLALIGVVAAVLLASGASFSVADAQTTGSAFTVNSTADDGDANPGNGVCATAAGDCTLRAAIAEANSNPGPDTIAFNIPGAGVHTIQLTNQLPNLQDLTGPTTIDGYTQPGSSPNTNSTVSNAVIRVQIAGGGHDQFNGLNISSPGNLLKGLAFYNLNKAILLSGSDSHDNHLAGDFIGTNAAGTFRSSAFVRLSNGVHISGGAANNLIGGTSPAERNVVSGNAATGVALYNAGANSNAIVGNLVGLSPAGGARLANKNHGIDINGSASYNVVGGTSPGERNVISGNTGAGVELSHDPNTLGNQVVGNFIGANATGDNAPAYASNGQNGVTLQDGASESVVHDNVIGNNGEDGIGIGGFFTKNNQIYRNWIGVTPGGVAIPNGTGGVGIEFRTTGNQVGPGNIIVNNPIGVAVSYTDTRRNTVTRNSIYNNTGLGIDIDPLGKVNLNDPDDLDDGANTQLNFPVLTSATPSRVIGTACANCTVEIFVADSGAGKYGEGKRFAGSAVAGTDGAFALQPIGVQAGDYATSTAMDKKGNTSEFSLNLVVDQGSSSDTTAPTVALNTPADGAAYTLNETVTADYSCEDEAGGSSLKSCAGDVADGQPIDTGTSGQRTFAVTAEDNAGNTTTVTHSYAVENPPPQDTTAPTINCETPDDRWHDEDVSLSCTASDSESGLANPAEDSSFVLTTSVPSDTETSNAQTDSREICDLAANCAVAGPIGGIKVDKKIPEITLSAPADGAQYETRETVAASYACADGGSGAASCTGDVPNGEPFDTSVAGTKTFTVLAEDNAGNTNSVTNSYMVGDPPPDTTAPTVALNTPADGAAYTLNETVTADYSCEDEVGGSGIDSCTGDVANGVSIDTGTTGAKTFTVTAEDFAGNTTSVSHRYSVVSGSSTTYAEDGFSRNATNGWGSADTGGVYSLLGNKSGFNVNGSAGTIDLTAVPSSRAVMLDGVSAQDLDGSFLVNTNKAATGGGQQAIFIARQVSRNNEYRARVFFNSNGSVALNIAKMVAGKQTVIGPRITVPGLTHEANKDFRVKVQVVGTSPTEIRVKVWENGQAEPSSWQRTANDSEATLQTAGAVGLRVFVAKNITNAPVRFSIDDLRVASTDTP